MLNAPESSHIRVTDRLHASEGPLVILRSHHGGMALKGTDREDPAGARASVRC